VWRRMGLLGGGAQSARGTHIEPRIPLSEDLNGHHLPTFGARFGGRDFHMHLGLERAATASIGRLVPKEEMSVNRAGV
jgi:hypothetical protein